MPICSADLEGDRELNIQEMSPLASQEGASSLTHSSPNNGRFHSGGDTHNLVPESPRRDFLMCQLFRSQKKETDSPDYWVRETHLRQLSHPLWEESLTFSSGLDAPLGEVTVCPPCPLQCKASKVGSATWWLLKTAGWKHVVTPATSHCSISSYLFLSPTPCNLWDSKG